MTSASGKSTDVASDKNGNNNIKVRPKLASILINSKSPVNDSEDEEYFSGTHMRPRANTDPVSPRPKLNRLRSLHVHFDLPDIVVDDCSDNDEDNLDNSRPEEINRALADTDKGAFFVFQSPPRERSNTCPRNMFSKKRRARNRPPTPPPADNVPKEFPRHPSWEKVSFCPHSLSKVTEDLKDSDAQEYEQKSVKSSSPTRSRHSVHPIPKGNKTTVLRNRNLDSPSSSPKRTGNGNRLQNGHVPRHTTSTTREVIHTTG